MTLGIGIYRMFSFVEVKHGCALKDLIIFHSQKSKKKRTHRNCSLRYGLLRYPSGKRAAIQWTFLEVLRREIKTYKFTLASS